MAQSLGFRFQKVCSGLDNHFMEFWGENLIFFLGRRKFVHLPSHSQPKPFIGKLKKRHWTWNESIEHVVVVLKTLSFVMRRLHHLPFFLRYITKKSALAYPTTSKILWSFNNFQLKFFFRCLGRDLFYSNTMSV